MLNKIFLGVFAFAVIVMGVLTFFAYRQLQSIGFAPSTIVGNFEYYESYYWYALGAFSLLLLILANVLLWTRKTAWQLWFTFLFAAVFIMLDSWWLSEILYEYKRTHNLSQDRFFFAGIAGALLCAGLAAAVFADQFLILRLRERMYPQPPTGDTPLVADNPAASAQIPAENEAELSDRGR